MVLVILVMDVVFIFIPFQFYSVSITDEQCLIKFPIRYEEKRQQDEMHEQVGSKVGNQRKNNFGLAKVIFSRNQRSPPAAGIVGGERSG